MIPRWRRPESRRRGRARGRCSRRTSRDRRRRRRESARREPARPRRSARDLVASPPGRLLGARPSLYRHRFGRVARLPQAKLACAALPGQLVCVEILCIGIKPFTSPTKGNIMQAHRKLVSFGSAFIVAGLALMVPAAAYAVDVPATATITGGSLTLNATPPSAGFATTLNGTDQSIAIPQAFDVWDDTGWHSVPMAPRRTWSTGPSRARSR